MAVEGVAGGVDGAVGVGLVEGEPGAVGRLLALHRALGHGGRVREAEQRAHALPGRLALLPGGQAGQEAEAAEAEQEEGGGRGRRHGDWLLPDPLRPLV